jgi:hypothetical protein
MDDGDWTYSGMVGVCMEGAVTRQFNNKEVISMGVRVTTGATGVVEITSDDELVTMWHDRIAHETAVNVYWYKCKILTIGMNRMMRFFTIIDARRQYEREVAMVACANFDGWEVETKVALPMEGELSVEDKTMIHSLMTQDRGERDEDKS